jgi:beta-lactamase superfamily II metal-dependent hydrolase
MKTKRIARVVYIFVIVGMVIMLLTIQSRAASPTLKASYIDVGHGDAILLQDGNGFEVLIDGGESNKGQIVVNYLKSQGVNELEVMVNSHPDSDHVAGLIKVLQAEGIIVDAVVNNGYVGTSDIWKEFATQVATMGLQSIAYCQRTIDQNRLA